MLTYGREICSEFAISGRREWLVTNGLGGYGMGTVAGSLSRSYHGLLVAAISPPDAPGLPPAARTLLLAKLDETASYHGQSYPLYADQWADEANATAPWTTPRGYRHLQQFHLEGTTPVWSYALADALLEKRVWMQPGANTTMISYRLLRASGPLVLHLAARASYRDHHGNVQQRGVFPLHAQATAHGVRVTTDDDALPFLLLSREASLEPAACVWQHGYHLATEHERGQRDLECYCHVAEGQVTLHTGETTTVVVSAEAEPELDGARAWATRQHYEQALLAEFAGHVTAQHPNAQAAPDEAAAAIRHLALAADQFIVRRGGGCSVIAGYPWFGDWGRDTMISLPGLTLATGRPEIARQILQTFATVVDQGMIPNRFPDAGETPEYNTIDATLWYVEALAAYHTATSDSALLAKLYPVLQQIVAWHRRGTRYHIRLDPADGLLTGGTPEVQLTWMDAKLGDWVVTPRIGKPVEINALWYNALRRLADFARVLGHAEDAAEYTALADQARAGFARFWNAAAGYCYDVLDGPTGHDPSLRPNQLLAVSLPHSPLPADQARAVVDVCARRLLTDHGLRSLDAAHPDYNGQYRGDRRSRDAAYHQGTVWGWLIGPFVSAHLRVYADPAQARAFLLPLLQQINSHGVGSLSEVFDGDAPFTPRACIAQAWTVAEVLRTWGELALAGSNNFV